MKRPEPDSPAARVRSRAAAEWLVKRDRRLTAAEQDAFSQWLADDPRHGEWFALHRRMVGDLDGLARWRPDHSAEPNPDLLARAGHRVRWLARLGLAAATGLALVFFWPRPVPPPAAPAPTLPVAEHYERRILQDGSTVELNRGAILSVAFTPAERRVTLARGEALFTVATNPDRPFVVRAGGVAVRAIGTAFNVRLDAAEVEVLVTEGRVEVRPPAASLPAPPATDSAAAARELPVIVAGQRATVSLTQPVAPRIDTVTAEETARLLAWHPQLLDFSSVPLERAVVEFNRRNRVQFRVADAELARMPIAASIRSDNIEGFARFLAETPGVLVERREGEIVLRRKP